MQVSSERRERLLHWYRQHRRDLPWRRVKDPYAIWVSEVMLQQTQVATVMPYYEQFLRRFPTVQALADADEAQVLHAWSGLGYYRRARLLHQGARHLVSLRDGIFPRDAKQLRTIPGIGRYTSGAIASVVWNEPEPIVDGNVVRVLCRWYGMDAPPDATQTQKRLWALAEAWVKHDDGADAGDFNQALMELGATVCTKQKPQCECCPMRSDCDAFLSQRQHLIPLKRRKSNVQLKTLHALLLTPSDQLTATAQYWMKQSTGSLFSGLWNFPLLETQMKPAQWQAQLRAYGSTQTQQFRFMGRAKHVLTHRHFVVDVWGATMVRKPPKDYGWVLQSEDARLHLAQSALTKKISRMLVRETKSLSSF